MDALIIAVLIVVVIGWLLGRSRIASRRAAEDAELGRTGMWGMSWLPAWLIIGGAVGHDGDRAADGSSGAGSGATDSFGDALGGGGDFGGGGGDFGGGSP